MKTSQIRLVLIQFSWFFLLAMVCSIGLPAIANAADQKERFPNLDPPFVKDASRETIPFYKPALKYKTIITEWKYHKSADGSHPSGHEQQAVWLMNRARSNPTREGVWLAESTDPNVSGGRDYFRVDKDKLKIEFAALPVKPPAAFDNRLYAAAYAHSLDLIARDAQDHDNQFDRVRDTGFIFRGARGSVFSYADSGINAHAGWNIDWGYEDDGMQSGRGHRMATMSVDGTYTNVGIAAIQETDPNTSVGEYVTTGNYCKADTSYDNHFNIFIVGTVWTDSNGNDQYDPGEGVGNITAKPDYGMFYAITGDNGGYAFPAGGDGTFYVTFSGGSLPCRFVKPVTVNGKSVLLDIETGRDFTADNCSGDPLTYPLPAILLLLRGKQP